MRIYVLMPILCCVFKTVHCRCFRDMYIDFKSLPVCVCIVYGETRLIMLNCTELLYWYFWIKICLA